MPLSRATWRTRYFPATIVLMTTPAHPQVQLLRDCQGCRLPGVVRSDGSISRWLPRLGLWYVCVRCGEVFRAALADRVVRGCDVVVLCRIPEDQLAAVDDFVLRVRACSLNPSAVA
jgi:hypothetical protein